MRRLLFLFLSLFALATSLCAIPLFPQTVVKYPLANGQKLELDFLGPKDALQYFDASVLTNGLDQLSKTYKLTNDFTVAFVPDNKGVLGFIVDFDGTTSGLSATLHPTTNAAGLRGLFLVAPRDALLVIQAWYKSYLANPSKDKSDSFVPAMTKTTFFVDYSAKSSLTGHGVQLLMAGTFQGDTPVFDPKMGVSDTDYSTVSMKNYHIRLFDPSYAATLRDDYFYVLDPLSDPANPGVNRDNITVYRLFDNATPPAEPGTVQTGSVGTSTAIKAVYNLGDTGPAGGIIFYDKGMVTDGWRYLEAAPNDQSGGIQWYNGKFIDIKTGTAVGTGKVNTEAIIAAQGDGTYAATLCKNLSINGFSDWFLPSKDELDLMYKNLKKASLGGFGVGWLWSSSQYTTNFAWLQRFSDGSQYNDIKGYSEYSVRAVRAF